MSAFLCTFLRRNQCVHALSISVFKKFGDPLNKCICFCEFLHELTLYRPINACDFMHVG